MSPLARDRVCHASLIPGSMEFEPESQGTGLRHRQRPYLRAARSWDNAGSFLAGSGLRRQRSRLPGSRVGGRSSALRGHGLCRSHSHRKYRMATSTKMTVYTTMVTSVVYGGVTLKAEYSRALTAAPLGE